MAPHALQFSAVIAAQRPRLISIGMRLTRRQDEAEDLVQETLARAWANWHRFDGTGSVGAWLARILTNLFISRHRHHRVVEAVHGRADILEHLIDGERVRGSERPDQAFEQRGFSGPIRAALEALPAHYRVVVELVDVEGLAYKDAADELGIPVGTVMSRLHRARRLLRGELGEVARDQGLVMSSGGAASECGPLALAA